LRSHTKGELRQGKGSTMRPRHVFRDGLFVKPKQWFEFITLFVTAFSIRSDFMLELNIPSLFPGDSAPYKLSDLPHRGNRTALTT
jgi:hypothetical protein